MILSLITKTHLKITMMKKCQWKD